MFNTKEWNKTQNEMHLANFLPKWHMYVHTSPATSHHHPVKLTWSDVMLAEDFR